MPYLMPETAKEALVLLRDGHPKVIAGCTDYFPTLPAGQSHIDLLDISRIPELRGVTATDSGWRIGAAATWTDVLRADLPPAFDGLKQAAREVGSVQIQNRGTLAGNICNASPAADGMPPLLSLETQVELSTAHGTRQIPLADFVTGVRQTARQADEMVTALHIPAQPDTARSAFIKLGSRTHLVISIAMVAAVVHMDGSTITQARIAVGSCSATAQRLPALEAALRGKTRTQAADMAYDSPGFLTPLSPISDVRGAAEYRMDVVAELCGRTLQRAMQEA